MSQTIDSKVVEMKFDNSNFETNVKQSMSTLDDLKKDLKLEDSANGFKKISDAAKEVSFDGLKSGIDEVKVHFSALETIAVSALATITSKAVDAGLSMAKSLSIDLIGSGWDQYEQKTQAVQMIMNATGKSIDDVNASLDELIWFADETSYSFSDMVDNAGKFTAVGVELEDAVKSMIGISNWAAVSGQQPSVANRAMFNLSQAMGMGYVSLTDWMSIEKANMNTKEFEQTVIDTAKAMGVLTEAGKTAKGTLVTTDSFRGTLADKWFTSDVLVEVLGRYSEYMDLVYQRVEETGESCAEAMDWVSEHMADSYDKIGEKAGKAGQEAKTFTDAINATKDAVKSKWATLFEYAFGNYEEATDTFTNLSNSLWDVFAGPIDEFNTEFEKALGSPEISTADWNKLKDEITKNLGLSSDEFKEFGKEVKKTAEENGINVDAMISEWGSFEKSLQGGWLTTDIINQALNKTVVSTEDAVASVQDVVDAIWRGDLGNGETRFKALEEMGYTWQEIQAIVEKGPGYKVTADDLTESMLAAAGASADVAGTIQQIREAFQNGDLNFASELVSQMSGADLRNAFLDNLFNSNNGVIVTYVGALREAFSNVFGTIDNGAIRNVLESLYTFSEKLLDEDRIERFKTRVENVFHVISTVWTFVKGIFSVVKAVYNNTLGPILSGVIKIITTIADNVGELFSKFDDAASGLTIFGTAVDWINNKLSPFKKFVDAVTNGIVNFINSIFSGKSVLDSFVTSVFSVLDSIFGKDDAFDKKQKFNYFIDDLVDLKDTVVETFKTIGDTISRAWDAFKNTELGQGIINTVGKIKSALSSAWESVSSWISGIFSSDDSDFDFFGGIQGALENFNTWLEGLDFSDGMGKVSNFAVSFKERAKEVFSDIKDWFNNNETIQGAISAVKSKIGELKDSLFGDDEEETGEPKKPFLTRVLETISTLVQWVYDNLPSINDIIKMVAAVLGGTTITSLITAIIRFKNLFSSGAGIATNFSKILSGISSALRAFSLQMVGSAIWDMAKSFSLVFGVLVAGLVALSFIDSEKLATVGVVLIGLGAGIVVLAKAIAEIMKTFTDMKKSSPKKLAEALSEGIGSIAQGVKNYLTITAYSNAILKVAIALGILVAAMYALSKISWEDCAKGLITIGALLAEVMLSFKLMGGKKLLLDMNALIGLSGAMLAFVRSFEDIVKYDWDEILRGIVTIGAILLELAMFTSFGSDMRISTGISMIAMGAAMLIFVKSIKQIADYEPETLATSIIALGAIIAEMTIASNYAKSVGIGGMTTMLVLAATMLIFCKSIKQLSAYSWDELLVSVLAMASVMAEIVGFSTLMQGIKIKTSAMVLIAELAITMGAFAGSLTVLSTISWDKLLISIGAMAAVLAGIVLFAKGIQTINMSLKQGVALAAISAAVAGFAIAISALAAIPWQQLVASAGAIAVVLLTIAGTAALLSVVKVNIDSIATVLTAMALLIAAVAAAIWLVVNALDGADLENVKINLGEIVTTVVSNVIEALVGSVDAIVQGIVNLISSIGESAPQLVDALIQLVVSVLNTLTERMPELATAIAGFVKSLIDSFCEAFADVDLTPLANVIQNLIIGVGALVLIGKFGGFGAALKGLGMFALVVTGIIALFTGLSALMAWVDGDDGVVSNFLTKGFEGLTVIAQGIGNFVGTLVGSLAGSAASSFSSSLPDIGTNLSTFMTNVQGFLDGASKIDSTFLASIGNLSAAMLEISGANFVTSIMDGLSWLIGGSDSTGFVAKFVELGNGLSAFADSISDVDFSTVENASSAASIISSLANVVPKTGGLWQQIVGEADYANVDTNFANLGSGVASFCNSIAGVTLDSDTEAAVTSAANVIAILMDKGVQSTGGLWQKIVGEKDMANAGTNFETLGAGVKAFCTSIDGVTLDENTESAVTSAANVIAVLMEKGVNTTGGLWQKIVGEKDMANAGTNFEDLGEGIANFCNSISGVTLDTDTESSVTSAANAISTLMGVVPNEGGLWQKIVGEKDMENAGTNFENLGEGVANFCTQISGVTIDSDTASSAADVICKLMAAQPTQGGLWQEIVGAQDPTSAPDNFKHLGEGVANFCGAVDGVTLDDTAVTAAAACAAIIKVFGEVTPATDGLWQQIVGETDLSKTGDNLADLGAGIGSFIESTKDTTKVQITRGKIAAQGMIDIINLEWPTEGGLLGWIANGIAGGETDFDDLKSDFEKIGDMCKALCTQFTDISTDTIENAKTSANGVIEIFNLSWPSTSTGLIGWLGNFVEGGETDFGKLKEKFGDMGEAIAAFCESVDNDTVNSTNIDSAKTAAESIITLFNLDWPSTDNGGVIGWFSNLFTGTDAPNWDTLKEQMPKMGAAIVAFVDSVSNITQNDSMKASIGAGALKNILGAMPDGETTTFTDIDTFSTSLTTLGTALSTFSTDVVSVSWDTVDTAESSISSLITTLTSMSDVDFDTATSFSDALGDLADSGIDDFTTAFTDAEQDTIDAVTTFVTNVADALSVSDDFSTAGDDDASGFNDGFSAWEDTIKSLATTIVEAAAKNMDRKWLFWTSAVTCMQGYQEGLNSQLNTTSTTASNIAGTAAESSNRYWAFWTSGTYCIQGFIAGMNAMLNSAAGTSYNIADASADYANRYWGFWTSGTYCMQGFIDGMNAYSPYVYNAAYAAGQTAVNAVNNAVGAASPAKEFIKTGKYSDMGLAKGLNDYAYLVDEASSDVAEGSIDTIKSVLSTIDTDSLDDAPTIRPVLDLSEIQNGASQINDMLYADGSYRIGSLNADRIAATLGEINADGTNGLYDDTEVIAVINDLGTKVDNLNTAINNIKLYLNGKDLVGGIATDMDNALGALSLKKKKGVL